MLCFDACRPYLFSLSAGQVSDSKAGMELLLFAGTVPADTPLLMDRAYEGDRFRETARELGYTPVVPPKRNRKEPWPYDKTMYAKRNQVERLFRRIKEFRRIFTRYDKTDFMFMAFILLAFIVLLFHLC